MKTRNRVAHVYPQLAMALSLVKHVHEAVAPPVMSTVAWMWRRACVVAGLLKHPRLYTQEEQTKRGKHFPRSW